MISSSTIETMQRMGGQFVKTLAALWLAADPDNRKALEEAFSRYFRHYEPLSPGSGTRASAPVGSSSADQHAAESGNEGNSGLPRGNPFQTAAGQAA